MLRQKMELHLSSIKAQNEKAYYGHMKFVKVELISSLRDVISWIFVVIEIRSYGEGSLQPTPVL